MKENLLNDHSPEALDPGMNKNIHRPIQKQTLEGFSHNMQQQSQSDLLLLPYKFFCKIIIHFFRKLNHLL